MCFLCSPFLCYLSILRTIENRIIYHSNDTTAFNVNSHSEVLGIRRVNPQLLFFLFTIMFFPLGFLDGSNFLYGTEIAPQESTCLPMGQVPTGFSILLLQNSLPLHFQALDTDTRLFLPVQDFLFRFWYTFCSLRLTEDLWRRWTEYFQSQITGCRCLLQLDIFAGA
jgi:hypothetical protein